MGYSADMVKITAMINYFRILFSLFDARPYNFDLLLNSYYVSQPMIGLRDRERERWLRRGRGQTDVGERQRSS